MSFSPSAKQSFYVFQGTLLSRILGFIRLILLGTTLGYTRLTDSYSLANETPNMMYELVLGSLIASTMVPFFVAQYKNKDRDSDNSLMTFVFVSALSLTALCLVLAPFIADLVTALNSSDNAAAQRNLVLFFMFFFIPQIFFYAMTSAMQAYLAARSKFIAAAFAPVVNNIVVIFVLLFVKSRIDELQVPLDQIRSSSLILVLAVGTTAGVALVTFVLGIFYIRAGGRLKLTSLRNKNVYALIGRSKWMILYSIANQIALFIVIALANKFEGGVAMYLVAWSFFQLPNGLIANSIMTTTVPKITHTLETEKDNINNFKITEKTKEITKQASTGLVILMGVVSALGISVAIPAVTLLIGRGNISSEQAEQTGRVLIAFLAFLPAFSLYLYCVRIGNSFNLTRQLFVINVIQNLANIILAVLLIKKFEIVGLSFAFSFSYLLLVPFSISLIKRCLKSSMLSNSVTIVMTLTCTISAALGYLASQQFSNLYLSCLAGLLTCIFTLVIGGFFVRKELKSLLDVVYTKKSLNA